VALDAVESGRGVGAFYRATEGRGMAGMRRGMAAIGGTSKLRFQKEERRGGVGCRRGRGGGIVATRFPCAGDGQRGAGVVSVVGGEEEALWRLGSHALEVARRERAWQLANRRWKTKGVWASWARWAASPGLAGSIKKAEALLGRRGMGRGKEAGCIADWAESDFGLPRENENVFEIFCLQS
jgi:hypothetical protein